MYCQACGAETPGELNYCNRCGASLNAPSAEPPPPNIAPGSFTKMALIIGLMLVIGLGIVFGGASDLARKGVAPVAIVWMAIFALATLFGVTSMFLRLWSQVHGFGGGAQPKRQPQPKRQQSIKEPPRAAQLPPPATSFVSVTENTTRTLEPALRASPTRDDLRLDSKS